MKATITLLPGDGIGPEVVEEGRKVLEFVAAAHGHSFQFAEHLVGGCAIDASGTPLPSRTLEACAASDAVLLGAVGGPKWDDPKALGPSGEAGGAKRSGTEARPEAGLLTLRRGLGLYANLRPVKVHPSLVDASPLKPERLKDVDILFVRELTGGLYFGQPRGRSERDGRVRAVDTLEYTDLEIRRVVRLAFRLAARRRRRVTSVDKANVLESSRLWREIAVSVAAEAPEIALEHQLVDSCAMRLITAPQSFDVVVTENMFGDILTDEAAVLAGSLGVLPSASLGDSSRGLYEPIHGSAPDIAGRNLANPIGTILSAALLLRHSLGLENEAATVERAVDATLSANLRTADLGGALTTTDMGAAIRSRLS
jgi:3-isopropylmalate dehydrogenase